MSQPTAICNAGPGASRGSCGSCLTQSAVFDHLLMRRLRPLTDEAAARGIDTAVDVIGKLPLLTEVEIAGLLAPLAHVLEAGASTCQSRCGHGTR